MIRTHDYTKSVKRYEAVGTHYVLAMVLKNLQAGLNFERQDPIALYRAFIARLVSSAHSYEKSQELTLVQSFQVSQFPRRRLLRSLKYVEEELTALQTTISQQRTMFVDLLQVLNPLSFHITTSLRITQYELERTLISRCFYFLDHRADALAQMQAQIQRLLEDTKTSVEINDDDHGKAILVFTIVTLVFLPLSFVASFLGMNTVDIRNQNSGQGIFWIVAVPVTSVVVVVSLLIGYRYEGMRDHIERYLGKAKND